MTGLQMAGLVLKTLLFLIIFWTLFLFVLPMAVSIVEVDVGIQRFPPQYVMSVSLLVAFTGLALWAALTLALKGRGTPLAIDPTQRLVTNGPYAYLRHPLAAAFTGQIVGLGVALGSIPVLAYAVVGLAAWYYAVRPREERSLRARFGERVQVYERAVRGFRPRLTPYRSDAVAA